MAVCPILLWPHPSLRAIAEPVADITSRISAYWQDMLDTMYAMPGVGLAAPQIGVKLRLAVVDCGLERAAVCLANPEIISASDTLYSHQEASPCLPGVSAKLARPKTVHVRFLNAQGAVEERAFSDLWSISVQHQIDHLNGMLYVHRLSRLRRDRLIESSRKKRIRA